MNKPNKPPRIPPTWLNLRPGDMLHSRMPLHRLEAIAKHLAPGFRFEFIPSPSGYFIRCEAAPNKRPTLELVK